jgi:hypothetical protein
VTATARPAWLHEGARVYDPKSDREGIVQFIGDPWTGAACGTAYLRPEGGGAEWTAPANSLRPADPR